MLCAFEGWNDAGDAASGAVLHLEDVWRRDPVAEFDPEDYYDFQVNRPEIAFEDGRARRSPGPPRGCRWRGSRCATRDVVLVHGIEPSMRWRTFTARSCSALAASSASRWWSPSARCSPTARTPARSRSADPSDEAMALRSARAVDVRGPDRDRRRAAGRLRRRPGIPAVSLWAAVPHYVAQPPCPKATLALLRRVEDLLDVPVPLGDLPEEARAWQIGVDELAEEDAEIAEYVRTLEEAIDTAELPEAARRRDRARVRALPAAAGAANRRSDCGRDVATVRRNGK